MLKLRILSAILGIPVLLFLVWSGGWLLAFGVAILATLGWKEFHSLAKGAGLHLQEVFGAVLVLFFPFAAYLDSNGIFPGIFGHMFAMVIILTSVSFVINYPYRKISDISVTFWGILYIGGLFSYWILVRELNGGLYWLLSALFLTWANDTGAYFVGRKWGKHKPWPHLSPKKTVEGAIGGLFFSIVTSLLIARYLAVLPLTAVLFAFIVGVVAQFGDLVESGLKRQAGVKDSGSLIPGHGGILDRFDSLILVMPVVYYFVKFGYLVSAK
jgi:phosphatidate cytidylyltransferase